MGIFLFIGSGLLVPRFLWRTCLAVEQDRDGLGLLVSFVLPCYYYYSKYPLPFFRSGADGLGGFL